jgi:hypothetical protein
VANFNEQAKVSNAAAGHNATGTTIKVILLATYLTKQNLSHLLAQTKSTESGGGTIDQS